MRKLCSSTVGGLGEGVVVVDLQLSPSRHISQEQHDDGPRRAVRRQPRPTCIGSERLVRVESNSEILPGRLAGLRVHPQDHGVEEEGIALRVHRSPQKGSQWQTKDLRRERKTPFGGGEEEGVGAVEGLAELVLAGLSRLPSVLCTVENEAPQPVQVPRRPASSSNLHDHPFVMLPDRPPCCRAAQKLRPPCHKRRGGEADHTKQAANDC
mmetsp:Transcript_26500/g.87894  ORF Transcript_26500/g.87894 Transcript_26500/m.87894 type:complete len:210 (-) Transcript_26500:73-702(-)